MTDMTVSELIAALKEFDGDLVVKCYSPDYEEYVPLDRSNFFEQVGGPNPSLFLN